MLDAASLALDRLSSSSSEAKVLATLLLVLLTLNWLLLFCSVCLLCVTIGESDGLERVILCLLWHFAVIRLNNSISEPFFLLQALHVFPFVQVVASLCLATNIDFLLVEAKVVNLRLKRIVALLTDQNLARCGMLHAALSPVKRLANQAELWFGVTKDANDGLTDVNADSDLHLLAVFEGD